MARRPRRLMHVAGIGVDRMGELADAASSDFLRLENLDVDIPPDAEAIERTRRALAEDDANSYLPFTGRLSLRRAAARHVSALSGVDYSGERNCVISAGGLSGILNVLLATVETGDEVIVTDPTYAGLINRIRLAGGVPKSTPFVFTPGAEWRLDREKLRAATGKRTRAMLLMSPSMPSGGYFDRGDWLLVAELCTAHDLLLILDAAMERLLFDGRETVHPAGLPGHGGALHHHRLVRQGAAHDRLAVGWIVAPESLMPDLVAVSLANVVVPVGLAQEAVVVALERSHETLPPMWASSKGEGTCFSKSCAACRSACRRAAGPC